MASVSLLDHTPSAVSTLAPVRALPVAEAHRAAAVRPGRRARRSEHELGVSHVARPDPRAPWLRATPAAVRAFLDPQERHDAEAVRRGSSGAIETIGRHIRSGSRIVVHGDYDVDGVCATAVLVRALRSLGADVGWYLPSRSEDGYGLSAATVARLCESGTDCWSRSTAGSPRSRRWRRRARPASTWSSPTITRPRADGELPDCPIVHPVVGGYPSRDLCGTAVAHKLAEALGAPRPRSRTSSSSRWRRSPT